MPKLAELQEKRGKLAAEIRSQADEADKRAKDGKPAFNAEDRSGWEKLNDDYDAVMEEIRSETEVQAVADRRRQLDEDEKRSSNRGRFNPHEDDDNDRRSDNRRDDNQQGPTQRDKAMALQGWLRADADMPLTDEHREACRRCSVHPGAKRMDLELSSTDDMQARQHAFRSVHPSQAVQRALTTGTDASGGYTVAPGFIPQLEVNLLAFDAVEQVATMMTTDRGEDLPMPTMDDTDAEGELVGESGDASTEDDPTFGQALWKAYKFSSKFVKIPYEFLTDNSVGFSGRLAGILGERIGRKGAKLFTNGTGVSQPTGIVTAASLGVTAAAVAAMTADELIDLQHTVDPAYRMGPGVGWMMNDSTIRVIRKLKDNDGQYLWQSGLSAGVPDMILGYRNYMNQAMDTLAATKKTVLFGDLSKYHIRRVNTIRIVRANERYVENDQVGFIAFLRQDGNLLDAGTAPVKYLQQAAA